jgi:hypothetical protein
MQRMYIIWRCWRLLRPLGVGYAGSSGERLLEEIRIWIIGRLHLWLRFVLFSLFLGIDMIYSQLPRRHGIVKPTTCSNVGPTRCSKQNQGTASDADAE